MKKRILFATAVALACTSLTSCIKGDDLELIKHPIHVTGEMHPTFGIPVGNGEMNMNDLLTSLSSNYNGMISDTGEVITVRYSMSSNDTVFASDFVPDTKSGKEAHTRVPKKNGIKADALTKDTVLETTVAIDFFNDVQGLDSIAITHVWADLSVGVHGNFGSAQSIAEKLHVTFDSVEIWYDDHNGVHQKFDDPNLADFSIPIENITADSLYAFPRMDMAKMVNDQPSKLYARYHLKLTVDPGILTENIANMSIQEIIDSLGMAWIAYSANIDLEMPLTMRIDNMSYDFDVDLGNGLSGVNLDSIVKSINQGLGAEISLSEFTLDLTNGIPLNLNLSAIAFSAAGSPLDTLFINETIPSAITGPTSDPLVEQAVSPSHHTINTSLYKADLEKLKKAKTLKVYISVNSDNKHVTVKRSDVLMLKAYLKVHPDLTVNIKIH